MCGYIVNLSSGNPKYNNMRACATEIRTARYATTRRAHRETHTQHTKRPYRVICLISLVSQLERVAMCVCVLIVRARTCAPCESLSFVCVCVRRSVFANWCTRCAMECVSLGWGGCLCCNCAARRQRDETLDCARAFALQELCDDDDVDDNDGGRTRRSDWLFLYWMVRNECVWCDTNDNITKEQL